MCNITIVTRDDCIWFFTIRGGKPKLYMKSLLCTGFPIVKKLHLFCFSTTMCALSFGLCVCISLRMEDRVGEFMCMCMCVYMYMFGPAIRRFVHSYLVNQDVCV